LASVIIIRILVNVVVIILIITACERPLTMRFAWLQAPEHPEPAVPDAVMPVKNAVRDKRAVARGASDSGLMRLLDDPPVQVVMADPAAGGEMLLANVEHKPAYDSTMAGVRTDVLGLC
jgi:hypothetical protein